ncbi:NACHT, LRR and PYD domains-containing protein 4 [Octodon degus]|uniref:NACHT, LRR and PYD domains-containing protein 4 n=1 Tax=Octodon degus TaxID=10160 RepID=A0A6P3V969_OCTDE|nr:NACHT, LRR and PYD domains-containing protein 4 [Octodon degus]
MASSFFSDFGLMWYLEELKKKEFMKFKEFLKEETLHMGLQQIPWAEVKKASREELASLLLKHYEGQQAWEVTFRIFLRIDRRDLCERATRESTGHSKMYQAHMREKFRELMAREPIAMFHRSFEQDITQEERKQLELLFPPEAPRKQSHTVLLHGAPGIGKTTYLGKIMLAWARGLIYQDRFSYVFYFCCQELKLLPALSLAELIGSMWPESCVPVGEILAHPRKVLFLVDNLDKLGSDLREPEGELCRDWVDVRTPQLLLSSLLRRRMIPECSLVVTVDSLFTKDFQDRLEDADARLLTGFRESDIRLCAYGVFEDMHRSVEAFSFIQGRERFYGLCRLPVLCWLTFMALKYEMDEGKVVARTVQRSTALYTSFFFHLFSPRAADSPSRRGQEQLHSLCSLAVQGMWTDRFVFMESDLRRNGIGSSACLVYWHQMCSVLTTSRHLHTLQVKHSILSESAFMVLFNQLKQSNCLVENITINNTNFRCEGNFLFEAVTHNPNVKCLNLINVRMGRDDVRFLCSVLGHPVCSVSKLVPSFEPLPTVALTAAVLLLVHVVFVILVFLTGVLCLYPDPKEDRCPGNYSSPLKAQSALVLHHHSRARGRGYGSIDRATRPAPEDAGPAHALGRSAALLLVLGVQHSFPGRGRLYLMLILAVLALELLCCLTWLLLMASETGFRTAGSLGEVVEKQADIIASAATQRTAQSAAAGSCGLATRLMKCKLKAEDCEALASVVIENRKLQELNLTSNRLRKGVRTLCKALCHPSCTLKLLTDWCWDYLAEVLLFSKSLVHLDLSMNTLRDEGLQVLCAALRHPACRLEALSLMQCCLTAEGCRVLATVLTSSQKLKSLHLNNNPVGDAGVKLLCDALVQPSCRLEDLELEDCGLTNACCEALAATLTSSRTLHTLNLVENAVDCRGLAVLFAALKHPECSLQVLGLKKADLDEEALALVIAAEDENPGLVILDSS